MGNFFPDLTRFLRQFNFELTSYTFLRQSNSRSMYAGAKCRALVKICPHSVWGCRQNSDPLSNLLVFLLHKIMEYDIHKLQVNTRNSGYLKCVLKPYLKVGIIAFYITFDYQVYAKMRKTLRQKTDRLFSSVL